MIVRQLATLPCSVAKQGHQHLVLGIRAMLGMHGQQRKEVHRQTECLWPSQGTGCAPVRSQQQAT